MTFLVLSFLAGILTVLAPCVLPLLPVVIGSSATGRSRATPYIVVASLGVSIVLFTFLLKVSTTFIAVPAEVWTYLSGGILLFFGVTLLFPDLWERIPGMARLSIGSNKLLGIGHNKNSIVGDILVGAALGPVFSTCSPTYFVILASVLPASFLLGTVYLFAYTFGLTLVLLLIALLGERFASKLSDFSDPHNLFRRGLGVLFIVLGFMIAIGIEKKIETAILNSGFFDVTKIETNLLKQTDIGQTPTQSQTTQPVGIPYKEITNPSGFVNTNDQPIRIADYVGKQVIMLDVMTYSCINCQRTFPYVAAWYNKYKDDGFIVIGIHTPEFVFEKDKHNVEEAMKRFGITFPVVLDNNYGTWNAYSNSYWPRKYLIDIHGNVVYDHIGEGGYKETEMKIRELLDERAKVLGEEARVQDTTSLAVLSIPDVPITARSPEIYFGAHRNQYLGNGSVGKMGEQQYVIPSTIVPNTLYLGGVWNVQSEYVDAVKDASVTYKYNAGDVYLVASADSVPAGVGIEVWQDGSLVGSAAGTDVGAQGVVSIKESRLYHIVHNKTPGTHTLELRALGTGVLLYTFTFG